MKALEFKSKVKGGKFRIPKNIQEKLSSEKEQDIRVIVLFEFEDEVEDEEAFKKYAAEQFFEGFAEPDSIYDSDKK